MIRIVSDTLFMGDEFILSDFQPCWLVEGNKVFPELKRPSLGICWDVQQEPENIPER